MKASVDTRLNGRLAATRNLVISKSHFNCALLLMSSLRNLLKGDSIDLGLFLDFDLGVVDVELVPGAGSILALLAGEDNPRTKKGILLNRLKNSV